VDLFAPKIHKYFLSARLFFLENAPGVRPYCVIAEGERS